MFTRFSSVTVKLKFASISVFIHDLLLLQLRCTSSEGKQTKVTYVEGTYEDTYIYLVITPVENSIKTIKTDPPEMFILPHIKLHSVHCYIVWLYLYMTGIAVVLFEAMFMLWKHISI